jgi:hypothetical protein
MYLSHGTPLYVSYNPMTMLFTISRTLTLTRVIMKITEVTTTFFNFNGPTPEESFEHFYKDFTALFQEYDDRNRKIRYLHPRNTPDDSLHSLNFAETAAGILSGDLTVPHTTQPLEFENPF